MLITTSTYARIGWIPVLGWCALIFWASSQSKVPEPSFWLPPHADKIIHAIIYAILASLTYPLIRSFGGSPRSAALIAILTASLYGMTDEWHQSSVTGRTADIMDWLADTIGACLVIVMAAQEHRLRKYFKINTTSP
jgi:VanZ family protein